MSLTALIAAYQERADGGGLIAAMPIAGRTLLERQVQLALGAGADRILVIGPTGTGEMAAALGRLRAGDVQVDTAGTAAQAAALVSPEGRLLLIGSGVIAPAAEIAEIAAFENPVLLTVPDSFGDPYERIDAQFRWGGLALVPARLLAQASRLPADWDLQSTLLRLAVQDGAARHPHEQRPNALVLAGGPQDLAPLEADMLAGAAGEATDWPSAYLLGPIEASATRRLIETEAKPAQLRWAGIGAALVSGIFFVEGWLWPGLALFLAATPLTGIARRLERLRPAGRPNQRLHKHLGSAASASALLALSYALLRDHGWGTFVLALASVAFLYALCAEAPRRQGGFDIFLAEPKGMAFLFLPFAAAGQWILGLGAMTLYAAGSFFWAQHRAHRGKQPLHQD